MFYIGFYLEYFRLFMSQFHSFISLFQFYKNV